VMIPKELIILGIGQGWKSAPHVGEAWGVRQLIGKRPLDRAFKMHTVLRDVEILSQKKAAELGIPFYTTHNYPIKEIKEFFKTDFFTNGVCYMLALAIYEGYKKIDLYGINQRRELAKEKCGVDYWCGQAMGRGIEVPVHGKYSQLMKTHNHNIYGYEEKQG